MEEEEDPPTGARKEKFSPVKLDAISIKIDGRE